MDLEAHLATTGFVSVVSFGSPHGTIWTKTRAKIRRTFAILYDPPQSSVPPLIFSAKRINPTFSIVTCTDFFRCSASMGPKTTSHPFFQMLMMPWDLHTVWAQGTHFPYRTLSRLHFLRMSNGSIAKLAGWPMKDQRIAHNLGCRVSDDPPPF